MGTIARRPPVHRSLRIVVAVAVTTATALAAVVVGTAIDSGTATAAPIRVDLAADGSRVVTLIDPRDSSDAIARALTAAGIRTETIGVASGPSRVNTVVSIAIDRAMRISLTSQPGTITLLAGFDGTVLLTVGVPTSPGQPYGTPSDPFAIGEPMAGFDEFHSAAAVARAAKDQGLTVAVLGPDGEPIPHELLGDEAIIAAIMVASDSLLIRLG